MTGRVKKPRRRYRKSGFTAASVFLTRFGTDGVDKRTVAGQMVLEFSGRLADHLGGDLTAPQKALVEMATRKWLLMNLGYSWLFEKETIIENERGGFVPIVRELAYLESGLLEILRTIGIDRKAKAITTLAEILSTKPKPAPEKEVA